MFKTKFRNFFTVFIGAILLPGVVQAATADQYVEKSLGSGSVRIYERGPVKIHAWNTGDVMGDECFLLETPEALIAIEGPAFKKDAPIWQEYIAGLGKPLKDVLISAHPAGGKWWGSATSHATAQAKKAIEKLSSQGINFA